MSTYSRSVTKRIEAFQVMINEDNDSWMSVLDDVHEPVILTALVWSWLDQLKVKSIDTRFDLVLIIESFFAVQ